VQSPISLISNFLRNTIDSSITIAKSGRIINIGNSGTEGVGEVDEVGDVEGEAVRVAAGVGDGAVVGIEVAVGIGVVVGAEVGVLVGEGVGVGVEAAASAITMAWLL